VRDPKTTCGFTQKTGKRCKSQVKRKTYMGTGGSFSQQAQEKQFGEKKKTKITVAYASVKQEKGKEKDFGCANLFNGARKGKKKHNHE